MATSSSESRDALFLGKPSIAFHDPSYMLRAQLAQHRLNAVSTSTVASTAFEPELARYLLAREKRDATGRDAALSTILASGESHLSAAQTITVCTVLMLENRPEQAATLLSRHPRDLECGAFLVLTHLCMNRVDSAKEQLRAMKRVHDNDDAVLIQLAESWINLRDGMAQDAFYAYEELGGGNPSPLVLNAIAVCHMAQGRSLEAVSLLEEAVGIEKDGDANAAVNKAICTLQESGGYEEVHAALVGELEDTGPLHPYLRRAQDWSEAFDEAAAKFAPSK